MTIDLTPLYRSSIGYEIVDSLLTGITNQETKNSNLPPYNIEAIDEDRYAITLAVAGFTKDTLNLEVHDRVLCEALNQRYLDRI